MSTQATEDLRELLEKATQGPWKYTENHIVIAEGSRVDYDSECLAVREDDAQLIALAPELAEECLRSRELLREAEEALIPAFDLLVDVEDGGYQAVAEVISEWLARYNGRSGC